MINECSILPDENVQFDDICKDPTTSILSGFKQINPSQITSVNDERSLFSVFENMLIDKH